MSLFSEALILTFGIVLFAILPFLFRGVRKHSKLFFLIGTGAMLGLCFFDLLPDVFEVGGKSSLVIIGSVWALYTLIHVFHLGHHEHDSSDLDNKSPKAFYLLYSSLVAHCLASGMLLALSHELSAKIASTVFVALIAHKGYEALMISTVLIQQKMNPRIKGIFLGTYALSLPLGVWIASGLKETISQELVIVISSVAVGTLLGCLIFDFFIPSLRQLRTRRVEVVWMLLGLLLTQVVIRGL